jgi:hypothetical protein
MIAPDWNDPILVLFRGGGWNEEGGGDIGIGGAGDGGSGGTCGAGGMILLPSTSTALSLDVMFVAYGL